MSTAHHPLDIYRNDPKGNENKRGILSLANSLKKADHIIAEVLWIGRLMHVRKYKYVSTQCHGWRGTIEQGRRVAFKKGDYND
jgi:hypothetical protein